MHLSAAVNNRAVFPSTPIGTKVVLCSSATMPRKMKVTDWMRRMNCNGSVKIVRLDDKGEELHMQAHMNFSSSILLILHMRAQHAKGSKKALMSERACIQKIADCVEHAPEGARAGVRL